MREHERFALSYLFEIDAPVFCHVMELPICVSSGGMVCDPSSTDVAWATKTFVVNKEPFANYAIINSPHCCEKNVPEPTKAEIQGMFSCLTY